MQNTSSQTNHKATHYLFSKTGQGKLKSPHQISALTARQAYHLGYFFILTGFTACTHLGRSISGQRENLTALKTKPWHFNTFFSTGKTKFSLFHLFQMFSTNSKSSSIQKSRHPRAIYWILYLPIHLIMVFKVSFWKDMGQPLHSSPPNYLIHKNPSAWMKNTIHTCKLLFMDYILRWIQIWDLPSLSHIYYVKD